MLLAFPAAGTWTSISVLLKHIVQQKKDLLLFPLNRMLVRDQLRLRLSIKEISSSWSILVQTFARARVSYPNACYWWKGFQATLDSCVILLCFRRFRQSHNGKIEKDGTGWGNQLCELTQMLQAWHTVLKRSTDQLSSRRWLVSQILIVWHRKQSHKLLVAKTNFDPVKSAHISLAYTLERQIWLSLHHHPAVRRRFQSEPFDWIICNPGADIWHALNKSLQKSALYLQTNHLRPEIPSFDQSGSWRFAIP